jgi:hypothetical protein
MATMDRDAITRAADHHKMTCPVCRGVFTLPNPPRYGPQGSQGYRMRCRSCGVQWTMPYTALGRALRGVGRLP